MSISQEAESPMAESATSRASSAIPRHVPGEPALWVLLFGDMAVFTFLFVFYLRDRRADTALFAESQERLHANIGVINTVILRRSSSATISPSACAPVASSICS